MTVSIPSLNQCLDFIERYEMLDNIRGHSFRVARVAELLVDGLIEAGRAPAPLPSRELVIAGALLHDIAKTECLNGKCRHDDQGQEICIALGFPEIGEIVKEHVILLEFKEDMYKKGFFDAKEIVYYADKRVRHDEVVSLERRLEYIIDRYGNSNPQRERHIRLNFQACQDLEVYLFTFLNFTPEQLPLLISKEPFKVTPGKIKSDNILTR